MNQPTKLFNKNYFLLWQGQFVSKLGSSFFAMATMLWIVERLDSESIAGLMMAVGGLVAVFVGPFAGTFADRYSRKKIIIVTDVLNGIVVLAFAIVTLIYPDRLPLLVTLLFFVTISSSVLISFFVPAISAAIPDLVPRNKLAAANSMGQFSTRISGLIGTGFGGVLMGIVGAPILFLINGLSYLFSAFSESFIDIPQRFEREKDPSNPHADDGSFKSDLIAGFKYIWNHKGLRIMVLVSSALAFFSTPITLLMAFFVRDFLVPGASYQQWYGFIMAVYGIGTLFGYLSVIVVRLDKHARARFLMFIIILNSAALGAIGAVRNGWLALAFALVLGIFDGYVNVNITTILQVTTPGEKRGRVFGVLGTLGGGLTPLAMALSGVLAETLHGNYPLIYFVCGGSMVLISLLAIGVRAYREFLVYDDDQIESPADLNPVAPELVP